MPDIKDQLVGLGFDAFSTTPQQLEDLDELRRMHMMKIAIPNTTYQQLGTGLAPRPVSLVGATIGFLDGWGSRESDGRITMYPLMRELRTLLGERYGVADIVWHKKKNVAQREPKTFLKDFFERCTVVINGEAA